MPPSNTNKASFSIDNIMYGNSCNSGSQETYLAHAKHGTKHDNKENGIKSEQAGSAKGNRCPIPSAKRARTPPGLENLPIPPPVSYPVPPAPAKVNNYPAGKSSGIEAASMNQSNALALNSYHAAAMAALFSPFGAPSAAALAPFLPNSSTAQSNANNSFNHVAGEPNPAAGLLRTQFYSRYHPYMNQLALAANLSQSNANAAGKSDAPTPTNSQAANNSKFTEKV